MILTITRAQLIAASACASGLDAWDRVSDACGVSRDAWTLDWTPETQVLALACPEWRRYFGWLVRRGLVPMWSMAHVNIAGAYLGGADLGGANLTGANLTGADLTGAYLGGADLGVASLAGADLRGADLRGANLRCADLRGVDIWGVDLWGDEIRRADLADACLTGARRRAADAPIPGWRRGDNGRLVRE